MHGQVKPETKMRPSLRMGFILLEQFTLVGFAGIIDALRLAEDAGIQSHQTAASWVIMTESGRSCRSSCGATISETEPFRDPSEFDYLAVCGGNGYENELLYSTVLRDYLREAVRQKVRLIGICTGTFALAHAGLVGPRSVCINWNVADAFAKRFPKIQARTDRLFMEEGDLLSCAGSTAAIDLGLHIITRHCGGDKARRAVRHMILQGARPAFVPQPYFLTDLPDETHVHIRRAVHFMAQNIDAPSSIEATARYVGTSARQLERLFRRELNITPKTMQLRIRLRYGQWLLSNSDKSIMQIAFDCGFSDAAHFTREYRACFRSRPSESRRVDATVP